MHPPIFLYKAIKVFPLGRLKKKLDPLKCVAMPTALPTCDISQQIPCNTLCLCTQLWSVLQLQLVLYLTTLLPKTISVNTERLPCWVVLGTWLFYFNFVSGQFYFNFNIKAFNSTAVSVLASYSFISTYTHSRVQCLCWEHAA